MKKKLTLITLIFLLTLIFYPAPSTQAQTCPSVDEGSSRIELANGFLTVRDSQNQASTKFNASDKCIIGSPAAIPQFSIPTYEEMKSLYVTQNKLIDETPHSEPHIFTNSSPALSQNSSYLYTVNDGGNLTVRQNFRIPKGTTVVVFVDGDLTIENDISDESDSGILFVVQGQVKINAGVTSVNAFIITFGGFCSSWAGESCISSVGKLTINGSLISFSPDPAKQPEFVRTNGTNIEPSEEIVYQPKYLVLFKGTFAKTLQLWSEVQ